jgi:cytochrome b pre-mRNA-processing protein 3
VGTNGIAIRACFGKPAFKWMQQGRAQRGALNEPIPGIFMIFGLFRKRNHNQIIVVRQYDVLTSMARQPGFYTDYDVPDTVMGRFELLSVVMILFFRRTRSSETSGQELAQEIVDAFFEDIDYSIRELGIGDNSVPKRMKKLAGMFYGRLESYAAAMDGNDRTALAVALQRNIYPKAGEGAPPMTALADWMMTAEAHLAGVTETEIATGSATLPQPSQIDDAVPHAGKDAP